MNNTIRHLLVLVAAAAMISAFNTHVSAQDDAGREERRERMIEGYKETLDVKLEEDWKSKIRPLVVKVLDAQREVGFGGFGGGGFNRGGGNRGGGGGNDQAAGNRSGRPGNPDRDALRKAVDDKAPADEVKEKLAKYRESRKSKEVALEKAQDELRKALSPRQEGAAVLAGLLK
jgi:hypothetical protein